MTYHNLKSIIGSNKAPVVPDDPTDSFKVSEKRDDPYIEPTFDKVEFDSEKPDILLISAVGATGKSTLSQELSHNLQLPILDLGRYEPVGGDTLTGILTSAYDSSNIGEVFNRLQDGSFGIIIDGIDEGKAKTKEEAFQAFLDDICKYTSSSEHTSFIMLGRTQALEDCYLYFLEKEQDIGLSTINPFDITSAKRYVDSFTDIKEKHEEKYKDARDLIIECIEDAFEHEDSKSRFESFIGYPPVLDSISAVLNEEQNYLNIINRLSKNENEDIEIKTLFNISTYIIERERDEKILPQILKPIVSDKPPEITKSAYESAYSYLNQSARLVAHCIGKEPPVSPIPDPNLQSQFEESIDKWLPEHPFLDGKNFRNVVFEAVALSKLMASDSSDFKRLATEYLESTKQSYHLVYMLDLVLGDYMPLWNLPSVASSALEFRSTQSNVKISVDGVSYEEFQALDEVDTTTDIEIAIFDDTNGEKQKSFTFETDISYTDHIPLQSPVGSLFITVPCDISLSESTDFQILSPAEVDCKSLSLNTNSIVVRPAPRGTSDDVIFRCKNINGYVQEITERNVKLSFSIQSFDEVSYPLYEYASPYEPSEVDPNLKEKYIRLRRILREFRSHGKGSLAKYQEKINQDRVLKNEIGERILELLLEDEIIYMDGVMYHLDTDKLDEYLGVNWHDFRLGRQPDQLMSYLRGV